MKCEAVTSLKFRLLELAKFRGLHRVVYLLKNSALAHTVLLSFPRYSC